MTEGDRSIPKYLTAEPAEPLAGGSNFSLSRLAKSLIPQPHVWPYFLASTDLAQPIDWHAVLDGSALSPAYALHGAIVDRRTRHASEEMGVDKVLRWLGRRSGRTVFLEGDAGDGKTSFVNLLAARSLDSHVFLYWKQHDEPFDIGLLENYRQRLFTELPPDHDLPTLVVICDLDPFAERSAKQRLINGLSARSRTGDGLVVLISGRPREISWFRRRGLVGDSLVLSGADSTDAQNWVSLLRRARVHLVEDGSESAESINERYPNLSHFLEQSAGDQEHLLRDTTSPVIVRLLRAVYGPKMPLVLYNELACLEAPDQRAYFHVCLATMAGEPISESLLSKFAPDADFDVRSRRDPWIRTDQGLHYARHPVIAQVVLEQASARYTLFSTCFADYAQQIRSHPSSLSLLYRISSAARNLERVGSRKELNNLHNNLVRQARETLSSIAGLAGVIAGQARDDYWAYWDWFTLLDRLIPEEPKDEILLQIVDTCIQILARARTAPNCLNPEFLDFHEIRLGLLRERIEGRPNAASRNLAIERLVPMVGAEWCRLDFYTHLFWLCRIAIAALPRERVAAGLIDEARMLYRSVSIAYEHLRKIASQGRLDRKTYSSYINLIQNSLPLHLPAEYVLDIVGEAWRLSEHLGVPNPDTAATYAKLLASQSPKQAIEGLLSAANANPAPSRLLLLLAQQSYTDVDDLRRRIEVVDQASLGPLAKAQLRHASALIESDSDRRIQSLRAAADAYEDYVGRTNASRGIFTAHAEDWDAVCRALQTAEVEDWIAYRQRYNSAKTSAIGSPSTEAVDAANSPPYVDSNNSEVDEA